MADSKPVQSPLATSRALHLADGSPPADATLYRQTVGTLQYLSFSRSDIAFVVNKLSKFMHSYSFLH